MSAGRGAASFFAIPAVLILGAGSAAAQDVKLPSLLVAPFGSSGARNMAAAVTATVRERVDSLGLFDQVDWDDLLDRSRVTRDLDAARRASLGCVQARQIAIAEQIDLVVCGGVSPTPTGLLVEAMVFDLRSGDQITLESATVSDRESVTQYMIEELRKWGLRGRDQRLRRRESSRALTTLALS